ncbi:MAG: hypothetical protein WDO73_14970 [Ignavibacteriota bacterium]
MHIAAGAQVQILAVLDNRQVVRLGELHGAAHDARVHYGESIVGDGDGAGLFHAADRR